MFRIFATNDDGIYGKGLVELSRKLAPFCEMTIVAPESPRSAASHSVTLHKPLRLEKQSDFPWPADALPGNIAYVCSGSPTDCAMLGVLETMKDRPPHLVISGINDGQNLAEDVTYSGTVAGAMEGAMLGFPAISVSLDSRGEGNYATASHYLVSVLERLLFQASPGRPWRAPDEERVRQVFSGSRFLNMNVPDLPIEQVAGVAACFTGYREYKDVVQRMTDPRGRPFFWIAGERVRNDDRDGSDVVAIAKGYVTVAPLTWDLTDYSALETVAQLLRTLR
ncbi:MAG: 5'/3'-nucleotidase SurE [Candidatus Riflebacteria bacterium RBG_13_59_9]|nr:MAG: 5'/3'-nucleotidase SurE [Candidatus Riflebacteria bacterium RBG_13_59_9]